MSNNEHLLARLFDGASCGGLVVEGGGGETEAAVTGATDGALGAGAGALGRSRDLLRSARFFSLRPANLCLLHSSTVSIKRFYRVR